MLGDYHSSPWASSSAAFATLRLPHHTEALTPGDRIQVGIFRFERGPAFSVDTLLVFGEAPFELLKVPYNCLRVCLRMACHRYCEC